MSAANVAGATVITAGAALVGAMSGWELGPYRLEFTRDQFAMVSAGICAIVALSACALAVERSESRAKSRSTMRRLTAFLFRSQLASDSGRFQVAGSHAHAASRSALGDAEQNVGTLTSQGACP